MKHFRKSTWSLLLTFVLTLAFLGTFAACKKGGPFAKHFTAVVGAYENGTLKATLLFSEAEAAEGRINLVDDLSQNITFRYSVDDSGNITFDFDAEGEASGTLIGKTMDVTATISRKTYRFTGELFLLTVKDGDEITEQGYVSADYPLGEAVTFPEETEEVLMEGNRIPVSELLQRKMPARDTEIDLISAD